ncbi:hypothetical protein [Flammeovirga pacifica]|uniref:Uncharacterized protein n=1 Tax=Flammeovirga pacifica TaxID=915059 RepID=A0A1S1YSK5_FLAPC|nr:hypothetical protein [Flammeovirga pacifica]OHX63785.1 hypothetical protein NH26_24910 [Flammeovirga pacifica]
MTTIQTISQLEEVKGINNISHDLEKLIRFLTLSVAISYEKESKNISINGEIEIPERCDEILDTLFLIKDLLEKK